MMTTDQAEDFKRNIRSPQHTGPFPQQRTDDDRCSNCRWRISEGGDSPYAEHLCHRFPPSAFNGWGEARFPMVALTDWCGEWQPREQGQS